MNDILIRLAELETIGYKVYYKEAQERGRTRIIRIPELSDRQKAIVLSIPIITPKDKTLLKVIYCNKCGMAYSNLLTKCPFCLNQKI